MSPDDFRLEYLSRRNLLATAFAAARPLAAQEAKPRLGIPGPYPGRVVAVHHPGSIASGRYQAEPVRAMMRRGMTELTGAPHWIDAWRVFAEPGDVVGIKVSPVGGRYLSSSPEVLHEIVEGLRQAGVRARDIVVVNRYRLEIVGAGIHTWLPEGVRWSWAAEAYDRVQLGMDGYDPDVWVEVPIIKPGQDPRDPHLRRSYVAKFLTRQINKMVNLPVLKHHSSAGVTLALKNISYGIVNNVNRSHVSRGLNATNVFIPAVVETPVIRSKSVLHILDGVKGGYDGGPGVSPRFRWEHKTMYFATDPVALDKIGWRAIDAKRAEVGLEPVSETPPGRPNAYRGQPEHIELAGALGLGIFDDTKMDVRKIELP